MHAASPCWTVKPSLCRRKAVARLSPETSVMRAEAAQGLESDWLEDVSLGQFFIFVSLSCFRELCRTRTFKDSLLIVAWGETVNANKVPYETPPALPRQQRSFAICFAIIYFQT